MMNKLQIYVTTDGTEHTIGFD